VNRTFGLTKHHSHNNRKIAFAYINSFCYLAVYGNTL